jgi:hypothetical protein
LPLWQFAWAATAALVLSFVALAALWKTPLLSRVAQGRAIPGTRGLVTALTWVARIVGLLLFGLVLGAALFGADVPGESTNIAPVTIYVILWVGVPVVAAILGDVWKALNPFRTIGLLFPEGDDTAPKHHWVAVATLFGFLFVELVHPNGASPRILGWAMVVYSVLMLAGMARHGRQWLDSADGFGVLFSMIGAIGIFAVGDDGELRARVPLSGLATVDSRVGSSALILVVLGGTSFDGFSESPVFWDIAGRASGWNASPALFIGLVVVILIASILYWVGARTTASVTGVSHEEAAELFAPSLIPILFGYGIAHYIQLLVDQVQTFWFRLSNPYGNKDEAGNNLTDFFGSADGQIDFFVIDADLVAWIQALAIVIGHVAGVLYAHDLAVTRFDHAKAARSQQTMLVVMVIYSVAGLWLLFSG